MNILNNELYDSYDELFGGQKKLGGLIRLLMYLLRHDTSGALKKDKDGYVKVDDLIKHPNIKNPDTVLDDIKTIIDQNKEVTILLNKKICFEILLLSISCGKNAKKAFFQEAAFLLKI